MKTYAVEVVRKIRMVVYYKATSKEEAEARASKDPSIFKVLLTKEDKPREMMNFKNQYARITP